DAYGHGAVEVARALEPLGVAGFAVARPEEGVELREAGARARILVGSPVHPESLPQLARHDLTPIVSGLDQLDTLEAFAYASGWRPAVHLKVDTGMHRLGVPLDQAGTAFDRLRGSHLVRWEGLLSHLADAELPSSATNELQTSAFDELLARLSPAEHESLAVHLANSAGALRLPRTRHDFVRPGLALYGGAVPGSPLGVEPVLALRGRIVQVQLVAAGERVGYGGRWRAERASRVGIVGIGYADGYPWRAGGKAEALVRGRRAPVVGAVSMDLLALDLTGLDAETGDEATLVGRQGAEQITVAELAERAGTIPYEVLCHLRLRLPRVWLRAGHAPATVEGTAAEAR
ncbi:MAG TPA: alanine racemase, partial [Thermoanaerobaculia bacterium]|nr:alanine racemase [Thermoanaerobaculia bacterium]